MALLLNRSNHHYATAIDVIQVLVQRRLASHRIGVKIGVNVKKPRSDVLDLNSNRGLNRAEGGIRISVSHVVAGHRF